MCGAFVPSGRAPPITAENDNQRGKKVFDSTNFGRITSKRHTCLAGASRSQFRCVKAPKRFAEKLRGFWGVNPGIDVASWDTMFDLRIEQHKNARKSIR